MAVIPSAGQDATRHQVRGMDIGAELAECWNELQHGRWRARASYTKALMALRQANDPSWQLAFCRIRHKGVDMARSYDDIWAEETRTGTMIASMVAYIRNIPEFSRLAYGADFLLETFRYIGARYPALRGKLQETRAKVAAWKRDADREARTGIHPDLDRKIDAGLQIKSYHWAEVKREMEMRTQTIIKAKRELARLEEAWKAQAAEYDKLFGPLEITQKLRESWLDAFARLPDSEMAAYDYDTTRFVEEQQRAHMESARRALAQQPGFEHDLNTFLEIHTKSLVEQKMAMLRRWAASPEARPFRAYFEGTDQPSLATGVMHIDVPSGGDRSPLQGD